MRSCIRITALVACLALTGGALSAAEPAREMHGAADAFAVQGVALAWGVLRHGGDAATVVLMIAVETPPYAFVGVDGIDPFTQQRDTIVPARAAGSIDARIPRAHFADYPRTEIRLFRSEGAKRAGTPDLVIFYAGVPDTTPEFADEGKLVSYLGERLRQARAKPEGKAP